MTVIHPESWTLTGWHRNQWRFTRSMELQKMLDPVVGPVGARVPGTVQQDLIHGGVLEDPRMGTKSLSMEWCENRDWMYQGYFDLPAHDREEVFVVCEGLDHHGELFINGRHVSSFHGMFLPVRVNISECVQFGEKNSIQIVCFAPPQIDGQYGFTSRISEFKARFNYVWDWCPRMVPIGIWRPVSIICQSISWEMMPTVRTEMLDDAGMVVVEARWRHAGHPFLHASITVTDPITLETVAETRRQIDQAESFFLERVSVPNARRWMPFQLGEQIRYRCDFVLQDSVGTPVHNETWMIGFRSVELQQLEAAPPDALPYQFAVNGVSVSFRGVNWVPLLPFYGSVTRSDYFRAIRRYRDMGANFLRVWGGGIMETSDFYEACDELGMLVWQEFPLCSSGIDNEPNTDRSYLESLREVASQYIRSAVNHPSHVLWCGGNELMTQDYRPVGRDHPTISLLAEVVGEMDPGKPFLPASPSGPRFVANRKDVGKGVHHDVHGPWIVSDVDEFFGTTNEDDALLRSEVGCPAASRRYALDHWSDQQDVWPPSNKNSYWLHRGAWWIQWDQIRGWCGSYGEDQLDEYLSFSRYLQAEALRYVAGATRTREGRCAGLVVWMGHDPFPNNANTSVIEADGSPKPAFYAIRRAWSSRSIHFMHQGIAPRRDAAGVLHVLADDKSSPPDGESSALVQWYSHDGTLYCEQEFSGLGPWDIRLGEIVHAAPIVNGGVLMRIVIREQSDLGNETLLRDERVFFRSAEGSAHALSGVRALPSAQLSVVVSSDESLYIKNVGQSVAFCATVTEDNPCDAATFSNGFFSMLPNEVVSLSVLGVAQRPVAEMAIRIETLNVLSTVNNPVLR